MGRPNKLGWHSRGYLPHFDVPGVIQHVVLAARLDPAGRPIRIFSDPEDAALMERALRWFDRERYDLLAWCVMPDHVHVMLLALPGHTVGAAVASWKRHVTQTINRCTGGAGALFGPDFFDRYARSSRQVAAMASYVESNPVRAGLCANASDWPWSSAQARASGWMASAAHVPVWIE